MYTTKEVFRWNFWLKSYDDFYDTKMGFYFYFSTTFRSYHHWHKLLLSLWEGCILLSSICKYVKFHRDYKIESVSKMCVCVCAHFIYSVHIAYTTVRSHKNNPLTPRHSYEMHEKYIHIKLNM